MAGVEILATCLQRRERSVHRRTLRQMGGQPDAVDPSFGELFSALNDEVALHADRRLRGILGAAAIPIRRTGAAEAKSGSLKPPRISAEQVRAAIVNSMRALMMVRVYRVRGHLEAKLDPLGLQTPKSHPELDPKKLRIYRSRFRSADFHRQRAGAGYRHPARDRRDSARHLLRPDRRRVHAHPGPGAEGLDPTRIEGAPWRAAVRCGGEAADLAGAHRGRRLRDVLPEALCRHQAVWA